MASGLPTKHRNEILESVRKCGVNATPLNIARHTSLSVVLVEHALPHLLRNGDLVLTSWGHYQVAEKMAEIFPESRDTFIAAVEASRLKQGGETR